MDKAHVYYGPDHGFEKYVEKYVDVNECMDFSEFIRRCDERSRKHVFHVKGQEEDEALDDDDDSLRNVNLIVSSDEYATVRDHVILNFDGFCLHTT